MYFPIIDALKTDFIAKIPSIVTKWLEDNVNPVGSAVVVDESLSISGAAADSKVTGDKISNLKSEFNDCTDVLKNLYYIQNPDVSNLSITAPRGVYPDVNKTVFLSANTYLLITRVKFEIVSLDSSVKIRPFITDAGYNLFKYGNDVISFDTTGTYECIFVSEIEITEDKNYRCGLYVSELSGTNNIKFTFETFGLFNSYTSLENVLFSFLKSGNKENLKEDNYTGIINVGEINVDNTGNNDCAGIINAIINKFVDDDTKTYLSKEHKGIILYFPNGKYRISDTINLKSNVCIVGQNMNNTIIYRDPIVVANNDIRYKPLFKAKGNPAFAQNALKIRGLKIQDITILSDYQCYEPYIDFECTQYNILSNVTIIGKGPHIRLNEDFDSHYTNLQLVDSGLHGSLDGQYENPKEECEKYPSIEIISSYAEYYGYSNTLHFIGCRFEAYRGYAIKFVGNNTNMCSFEQCKFESNECITSHIYIQDRTADLSMSLCTFGIYDNLNDDVIKINGTLRQSFMDAAFSVTKTSQNFAQLTHNLISASNGNLTGNIFIIRMKDLVIEENGNEVALFGNDAYITKSQNNNNLFYAWNDTKVIYDKLEASQSSVEDLHITNEQI